MFVVGLTGGIASGKSAAAACFERRGLPVVDTDRIARDLTAPGTATLAALREQFGDAVFDGPQLSRPRLRRLIFADASQRRALEAILHPRIRAEAARQLAELRAPLAVLVVPLLVEHLADWRPLIDTLLVIDCPEALQLARLATRDGTAPELAHAMLAAQASRATRRAVADAILVNDRTPAELCTAIDRLLDAWRGADAPA